MYNWKDNKIIILPKTVKGEKMSEIYTIGYSGFDIESFISTLKKYNINSLIDVRSNLHSMIY